MEIYDSFLHPVTQQYALNIRIEYHSKKNITRKEINSLHNSIRAQAAHEFDLNIRL